MYIVIYEKTTKRIVRVIEQTDKLVSYGYSDNCAEMLVSEKPTSEYIEREDTKK